MPPRVVVYSMLASRVALQDEVRALLPPNTVYSAGIHALADALRAAGKLDAAVTWYRNALAAHPAMRTSDDPDAQVVCHHAAALFAELGALDEATQLLLAAVSGMCRLIVTLPLTEGFVHLMNAFNALITVSKLADALEKERRVSDAVTLIDDALYLTRRVTGVLEEHMKEQAAKLETRRAELRAKWWCANNNCVVGGGGDVRLMRCAGCRAVSYCSQACQREAWGAHRPACRRSAQQ